MGWGLRRGYRGWAAVLSIAALCTFALLVWLDRWPRQLPPVPPVPNRVVVIGTESHVVGPAVVLAVAAAGHHVAAQFQLNSHNAERAAALLQTLAEHSVVPFAANVCDAESIATVLSALHAETLVLVAGDDDKTDPVQQCGPQVLQLLSNQTSVQTVVVVAPSTADFDLVWGPLLAALPQLRHGLTGSLVLYPLAALIFDPALPHLACWWKGSSVVQQQRFVDAGLIVQQVFFAAAANEAALPILRRAPPSCNGRTPSCPPSLQPALQVLAGCSAENPPSTPSATHAYTRFIDTAQRRRDSQRQAALKQLHASISKRLLLQQRRYDASLRHVRLLPQFPQQKQFAAHPNRNWPHDDIIILPGGRSIADIAAVCQATTECVGFTSTGRLKKAIPASSSWAQDDSIALYVATNLDLCAADLHHCARDAECVATPGQPAYTCRCRAGFAGDGEFSCVPLASAGLPDRFPYRGPLDHWDTSHIRAAAPFVFVQGMDSPLYDIMMVDNAPPPSAPDARAAALQRACRNHPRCLAVNTNGILKSQLQPPRLWQRYSNRETDGLYVMDVNYCELAGHGCPRYARCAKLRAGQYECRCTADGSTPVDRNTQKPLDPPDWYCPVPPMTKAEEGEAAVVDDFSLALQPQINKENVAEPRQDAGNAVLVVFAVDQAHLAGLPAALRSVQQNVAADSLPRVRLAVLVVDDVAKVERMLRCRGFRISTIPKQDHVTVRRVDVSQFNTHIRVEADVKAVGNLASTANFARFLIADIFPQANRAMYLDVDVVVQQDVVALVDQYRPDKDQLLAAVPRSLPLRTFFKPEVADAYFTMYGTKLDLSQPSFNAGVLLLNLEFWRRHSIFAEILRWMKMHAETPMWSFGTQPLLLITSYGRWHALPTGWNVDGLGYRSDINFSTLQGAALLHWSGRCKPWMSDGLYKEYWHRYNVPACHGHGTCAATGACVCDDGFRGHLCQDRAH